MPSPSPTPSPAAGPALERIGEAGFWPLDIVGFGGGYVAVAYGEDGGAAAWFSPDGASWEVNELSQPLVCGNLNLGSDSHPTGRLATNGAQVLLLGGQLHCDYTAEAGYGAGEVVWISADGRTWQKSEVFGYPSTTLDDAWPIPGGWEATISAWNIPPSIWRSSDGITWQETAAFANANTGISATGAASDDGTRLLALTEGDQRAMRVSSDGIDWQPLPDQPPLDELGYVQRIFPPAGPGARWQLVSESDDASLVWTSVDLREWRGGTAVAERIILSAAPTRVGLLVSAELTELHGIVDCPDCPSDQRQYLSADGLSWTEIPPGLPEGIIFADGPAGVIGISGSDGSVWRVVP